MTQLIIFDHSIPSIHFYNVASEININESYIHNLGFHTSNCDWMFGENVEVNVHNEVLQ